jgi:hypothetical protein
MKIVRLVLFTIVIAFSSCSEEDATYKISVLNFQDCFNLLGSSYDNFINQYPYSVTQYNSYKGDPIQALNTYFKGTGKNDIKTAVFYENNICKEVSLNGKWVGDQSFDWFIKIAEEIYKFAGDVSTLSVECKNYFDHLYFKNFQAFKNWIYNEKEKDQIIKNISFVWKHVKKESAVNSDSQGITIYLNHDFLHYYYGNKMQRFSLSLNYEKVYE